MATAPAADAPAQKPKSIKKLLIIVILLVVVLGAAGVGALLFLKKSQHSEEEGGDSHKAESHEPKAPPIFLPIDNMVVNLADPGGNRFAQIGITLQVDDNATSDQIKTFMPSIRNGVLLILSQRTTDELLQVQGKEQLASDITKEISRQLGYDSKKSNPIQAVLFSSFIIQ